MILLKKPDYNVNITEIDGETLSISGLATNSTLTAVDNKIKVKKKQTATQKLLKLKRNLLIKIMTSILLLQNLIL